MFEIYDGRRNTVGEFGDGRWKWEMGKEMHDVGKLIWMAVVNWRVFLGGGAGLEVDGRYIQ